MFSLDDDIYNKSRQMALSERLGNQNVAASQTDQQVNQEKLKQAKIQKAAQYLGMATPDNWQAIRSQAIDGGLGNEDTIPQQYDKNWINQTRTAIMSASGGLPSGVQEYSFYNTLNPQEQEKYLNVKRAQQVINLGGTQAVLNPTAPGLSQQFAVTPKPDQMPDFQRDVETAKEQGKQKAENQFSAMNTGDIVGLYDKLKTDAASAPSGAIESGLARASNTLNVPTKGAIAQGTFDADLNNLYLATIRSLKGTGRVMEQELKQISEAAPKPSDSTEVKVAKANAHMQYYMNRMKELGYDPATAQPKNNLNTPIGQSSPASNAPAPGSTVNWGDFQ